MKSKTKNVSAMVQIPVAAKGQTEVRVLKEVRAQVAVMGHAEVKAARVLVEAGGPGGPRVHVVLVEAGDPRAHAVLDEKKVLRDLKGQRV
jgi:hypothetical protein